MYQEGEQNDSPDNSQNLENHYRKREKFAVSLRKEKKKQIISKKRIRI